MIWDQLSQPLPCGMLQSIQYHMIPADRRGAYERVLAAFSTYYNGLNEDNRQRFVVRLERLFKEMRFVADRGYEVRPDMKIVVLSALVQVTFGLDRFTLNEYNLIELKAGDYVNKETGKVFRGHVDTKRKSITLSWPGVQKGFQIPDDAYNSCIHEFSHCLVIENSKSGFLAKFFDLDDWQAWKRDSHQALLELRADDDPFMRKYAATNMMEFFAVAVETFFEQPQQFKVQLPELYKRLGALLNQDPCRMADPVLE